VEVVCVRIQSDGCDLVGGGHGEGELRVDRHVYHGQRLVDEGTPRGGLRLSVPLELGHGSLRIPHAHTHAYTMYIYIYILQGEGGGGACVRGRGPC
jgi:hypothetical protein